MICAVLFNGKEFVLQDPFPALLVMPIAVFGASKWTEEIASLCVGLAAVGFYWLFLKRFGLPRGKRLWLTAFIFLGTDLYWCTSASGVWFLAVLVSNLVSAWTFCELAGKRRGWLIGFLSAAAVFTRPTMVIVVLLYPYLMIQGAFSRHPKLKRDLVQYTCVVIVAACVWVLYNEVRFGTIDNIGYQLDCVQIDAGICAHGLFGLQYLPYQIYAFFLRPPGEFGDPHIASWPFFRVDVEGIALTFASPALIAAFWAQRSRTIVALWIAAIATAIPSFLYNSNGYLQVGMRHALDFEPFLFALMAFALRDNDRLWHRVLIAISCFMGLWQSWFWWFYMDK